MRPVHGGNLVWAAAIAGCSPDEILDFSASISPLGPPQSALAAISANLSYLSSYPDPDYRELKAVLSGAHQLPPECILPSNGSAELLTWAGWELAKLASVVLVTPAFSDYYRALKAFNAKVVPYPLDLKPKGEGLGARGEGREEEEGERGRQGERGKHKGFEYFPLSRHFAQRGENTHASGSPCPLVPLSPCPLSPPASNSECGLLINNPHNPTGKLFCAQTILPYLDKFALVVVDEAFMDFLPPEQSQSLIPMVEKYPNLVILRSLTKFYSLPGLRLGYAIAHPDRLERWQKQRDPWAVNTLAAAAAMAVVQDTEFQQQTWSWLPPTRLQLQQGLAQIPGLQPEDSAANFLLVESTQPTHELQQRLLQQHQILIRDCLSFPELGDRYFRVAVRSQPENERLLQALWQLTTIS